MEINKIKILYIRFRKNLMSIIIFIFGFSISSYHERIPAQGGTLFIQVEFSTGRQE